MKKTTTLIAVLFSALVAFAGNADFQRASSPAAGKDTARFNRPWYRNRIAAKADQIKHSGGNISVLFLGDSITHYWDTRGKSLWQKEIAPFNALNYGFSGDRTFHTLWHLEKGGTLDRLKPRLVVLMIGTNNIGHKETSPEAAAAGIRAILNSIRKKFPQSKVLLYAVFPRSQKPNSKLRQQVNTINGIIKNFADNKHIFFEDISAGFLTPDGILPKSLMPDFLHPNKAGYAVWCKSLKPYLIKYAGK